MTNTFKYLLIFAFLSPLNLLAQSLIPVENHYFEKGNYWVWEYKNHKGEHNSFEKYEVEPLCLLIGGLQISQRLEPKLLGLIITRFIDSLNQK